MRRTTTAMALTTVLVATIGAATSSGAQEAPRGGSDRIASIEVSSLTAQVSASDSDLTPGSDREEAVDFTGSRTLSADSGRSSALMSVTQTQTARSLVLEVNGEAGGIVVDASTGTPTIESTAGVGIILHFSVVDDSAPTTFELDLQDSTSCFVTAMLSGLGDPPTFHVLVSVDSCADHPTITFDEDLPAGEYEFIVGIRADGLSALDSDTGFPVTFSSTGSFGLRLSVGDPCTVKGTDRANELNGTSGPDVICGLGGNDTINGLGGDDVLIGGEGDDTINGGGGNDNILGGPGFDTLTGGTGSNWILGGSDSDDISTAGTSTQVEILAGCGGSDTITGGVGSYIIEGDFSPQTASDDVLATGELPGATAADVDCEPVASPTPGQAPDGDLITGGPFMDILRGGGGADQIAGRGGDDTITGGPGGDVLLGGPGDDTVRGEGGSNTLIGGEDADRLTGGPLVDRILGCAGRDTINGAAGDDSLHGDNDGRTDVQTKRTFPTQFPAEEYDCAAGQDRGDTIDGGPDRDTIEGEAGPDTITPGGQIDTATGNGGNDTFVAADGFRDRLDGGADRDTATVDRFDVLTGIEARVR